MTLSRSLTILPRYLILFVSSLALVAVICLPSQPYNVPLSFICCRQLPTPQSPMTKPSLAVPISCGTELQYAVHTTVSIPLSIWVVPTLFLRSNYLVLPASSKTLDKTSKVT